MPPIQRPELDRLIAEAKKRLDAMPPEERQEMRRQQRASWVIGEYMLAHPEATREEAEAVFQKALETE